MEPATDRVTLPRGRARKDAIRNQRRLMEATGEVLRSDPGEASMGRIAAAAGLSVATAYRYFSTVDEMLAAYLHGVIVSLRDASHDHTERGAALFEAVLREWFALLDVYGAAMVQLRGREGFLARLHSHDPLIMTVRDAWERPIRGLLRELEISDDHFEWALMLYNILFDPREVLDLRSAGLSEDEVSDRLRSAYYAALSTLRSD